jgi:hypothetical protein
MYATLRLCLGVWKALEGRKSKGGKFLTCLVRVLLQWREERIFMSNIFFVLKVL